MSIIRPFKGFRPRKDMVKEVASPPYDVVNTEESRELVKGKPYSFLHVVRSEVDLPEEIDPYDPQVYQKAKENLQKLISDNILVEDSKPSLYLYQQQMGDHKQIGILACAAVEDYMNDVIKKHELTRADKEKDRIRHVDTLNANTGPVFLTYPAVEGIDRLIEELIKKEPDFHFEADDKVIHTLWQVDDPETIEYFVKEFSMVPTLYVADGHHRSASAAKVGAIRKEANPDHTGDEEYNFFLAVFFPHNQLKIMDYNRVVKDLGDMTEEEFLEKVQSNFDIELVNDSKSYKPEVKHRIGMYMKNRWYILTPKIGTFDENDPVQSLDVAILQSNLLTPILNITDPRKDNRIDFVGGIRGIGELEKRVNKGEAVAFALYPTDVEDLMSIADSGKIMPPKSTWFEPKLRSGLVVHFLS